MHSVDEHKVLDDKIPSGPFQSLMVQTFKVLVQLFA